MGRHCISIRHGHRWATKKPIDRALVIEWGGLTAGPAVLALLLIVFGLIALKFV